MLGDDIVGVLQVSMLSSTLKKVLIVLTFPVRGESVHAMSTVPSITLLTLKLEVSNQQPLKITGLQTQRGTNFACDSHMARLVSVKY